MKKTFLFLPFIILALPLLAQKCKPDYSKTDAITKDHIDAWSSIIYQSSFGNAMMNSSEVYFTLQIGRFGNRNSLTLSAQKEESSVVNASAEGAYVAIKGDEFYFGLKGGSPMKFKADEAQNQRKVDNLFGKLIVVASWTMIIKDEDLPDILNSLTAHPIDAIRITNYNGGVIEKIVKEAKAIKMQSKFKCFAEYAKEKGLIVN